MKVRRAVKHEITEEHLRQFSDLRNEGFTLGEIGTELRRLFGPDIADVYSIRQKAVRLGLAKPKFRKSKILSIPVHPLAQKSNEDGEDVTAFMNKLHRYKSSPMTSHPLVEDYANNILAPHFERGKACRRIEDELATLFGVTSDDVHKAARKLI